MINENERRFRNTKVKLFVYVIFYILICICGYLCKLYLSTYVWYGEEAVYPLFHFLKQHLSIMLLIGFAIGIFIILWYDYKKMKELVAKEKKEALRLAEQSEKRKNDLVMYLAHDLKTPLTSILGYLELLQNTAELTDETKQKYMAVVSAKAERLEELLDEFFEITRYNLTQITLVKSHINLTRMMEQLIFEFQPMLMERNLTCEFQTETGEEILYYCDADRIQRVFSNLLKNAVYYSFEETVIYVTLKKDNGHVEAVFENEGNTIPKEKLTQIFEQFFRLDSARGTKSGGTGIGLAIAKEIVELHGGSITAFSEDNRIRFTVQLPVKVDFVSAGGQQDKI